MSPRTAFLSKLIGLYSIVVSLAMFTHREATVEMITAALHSSPILFLFGIVALTGGLAMVLGHNVWSGGATPVVVTLLGWSTLIKGVFFLFLSPEAASGVFLGALRFEQYFYFYAGISFLIGVYLTYAGARSGS